MAYSKKNKEKIAYLKAHPEIVYQEYIVNKKSTYKLVEEWGLPKSTVYQLTKEAGLVGIKLADKLTTCDESKFDINDPVFCYMAGLMSADSYIDVPNHRVVIRMGSDAHDILEYLRDYFDVSNDIKTYHTKGGYVEGGISTYDLTISSQKLIDVLATLNIVGRKKDLGIRFPDMSGLTDECQEMYMRGLWDGDGTVRKGGSASIFQQSIGMIESIAAFVESKLGIPTKITERVKSNTIIGYDLYFSGQLFYNWLYRNRLEVCIESKFNRIK